MTHSTITPDHLTVAAIVQYIKTELPGHSLVLSFQEILDFCQEFYDLNNADKDLIDDSLVHLVWESI